jgi:glycosyltransferase involved in cell wall biosynthesis
VLANPGLRAEMSANNRQLVAGFSPAAVAQGYIKVYDSLLG